MKTSDKIIGVGIILLMLGVSGLGSYFYIWYFPDEQHSTGTNICGVNLTKQEMDTRINIIQYSSLSCLLGIFCFFLALPIEEYIE